MKLLLSIALMLLPAAPPRPVFHAVADWTLTAEDRAWLEQSYLPDRWAEARALVAYAYNVDAPTLEHYTVEVRLHPAEFLASDGQQWLIGRTTVPGILENEGLVPLVIEAAWNREMLQHVTLSHEFCHLDAFFTYQAGWEEFGHGTRHDPFLQRLTDLARRVYIPGHSYDPFKAGVL